MKLSSSSQIEAQINLSLSEKEARALKAITEYGISSFLEVFYTKLGKEYLKPSEDGLQSLFNTITEELPKHLARIELTKRLWQNDAYLDYTN